MNIHEYQAKQLLAKFGIGVPAGYPARTVKEAVEGAKQLPGPRRAHRAACLPAPPAKVTGSRTRTAGIPPGVGGMPAVRSARRSARLS